MTEFDRVALASRAFSLAAIAGFALTIGSVPALGVTLAVLGVASVASYVSVVSAAPTHWIIAVEGTIASVVVAAALPQASLLLPYLVVLPLLAGLARSVSGASLVIICQLTATLVTTIINTGAASLETRVELLAPWAVTIVVAGIVGAWARKVGKSPHGTNANENYDSARRLLGQLRNLARRLPSGLDPVTISSQILSTAEAETGCVMSAIFVRTEGRVFAPLAYRGVGAEDAFDPNNDLFAAAWSNGSPASEVVTGAPDGVVRLVLPLRLGSETVGLVVCHVAADLPARSVAELDRQLHDLSLRLAAALAFDDLRTTATSDERQRLAREIHDGVAQEVASLGYVVDDLTAMTDDPTVAHGLKDLRGELSRLVTELRLSIFDLRTEVAEGNGLGSALSDYVRKVGARSSMRVHLSLDEASTRLAPVVETELFRIAQEAVTNARKHSHAENLWVDCWVRPPSAILRVRDDGRGLGTGRPDSYGLRIMHERAQRIDANLVVEVLRPPSGGTGTSVTVSLGQDASILDDEMRKIS